MEENNYTYVQLLKAIENIEERERTVLLSLVKISDILSIFDSEDAFNEYMDKTEQTISFYQYLIKALEDIKYFLENPIENMVDFKEEWSKQSDDDKLKLTVDIMNIPEFQKNCSKVLMSDFKRIAQTDETIAVLDRLFGFSEHMEKLIDAGIGCNHAYMIESGSAHEE